MLRNVELDLSGDGSVYPAGRQPGWCLLLMDVVEDLLDRVWLGDRCDDAQPTTALGTHLNIYFEDPLEWYVTRRSAQESGARGRSVSRSVSTAGARSLLIACLRLFFARRLGVGTTRLRYLALGASTP